MLQLGDKRICAHEPMSLLLPGTSRGSPGSNRCLGGRIVQLHPGRRCTDMQHQHNDPWLCPDCRPDAARRLDVHLRPGQCTRHGPRDWSLHAVHGRRALPPDHACLDSQPQQCLTYVQKPQSRLALQCFAAAEDIRVTVHAACGYAYRLSAHDSLLQSHLFLMSKSL